MLLFVGATIIILTCCIILHYKEHFKCQCSRPKSNKASRRRIHSQLSVGSPPETRHRQSTIIRQQHQSTYRCIFTSADNEDFDFFPVAFFFYLLFLIFTCTLIMAKCFIFDAYYEDQFGTYFTNSFHEHFESLASHDATSMFGNKHNIPIINIINWILVYSIMFQSIWESLFCWYRFYTTLYSTVKFYRPSASSALKKFSIYAIIFVIAFIIEIHVTYWMFPIVVLLHSSFNVFCTLQFASLLIQKYRIFITMGSSALNKKNDKDILKSVYFMRKTSLFCTLIQSLCLSLFAISYNIDITYYLPILWAISCIIFTLNFVRNRQYASDLCYSIFWMFRYGKCCIAIESYIQEKREKNRKVQRQASTIQEDITPTNGHGTYKHNLGIDQIAAIGSLKIKTKFSKTHNSIASNSNINAPPTPILPLSSPSVPNSIARDSIIKLPPKHPNMKVSHSVVNMKQNGNATPSKKSKKAFAILGLHETSTDGQSESQISPIKAPHKRSQTNFNFGHTHGNIGNEPVKKNIEIDEHRKLDMASSSVPLPNDGQTIKFKPKTFPIKEENDKESRSKTGDNNDAIVTLSPINEAKNTPLIMAEAHSMPTPLIKISDDNDMEEIKNMNELIFDENELNDDFVYMDEDLKMEENDERKNNNQLTLHVPKIKIENNNLSPPIKQSHSRRHTKTSTISILSRFVAPITPSIDRTSIDLENVVTSLEILVGSGFCSRLSVNNIKQIKSYKDQYDMLMEEIAETVNNKQVDQ